MCSRSREDTISKAVQCSWGRAGPQWNCEQKAWHWSADRGVEKPWPPEVRVGTDLQIIPARRSRLIDLDQRPSANAGVDHLPTRGCTMLADDVADRDLLDLADETGRMAESVGEPAIRTRLQEMAAELQRMARP
jgi:hypothetical protein